MCQEVVKEKEYIDKKRNLVRDFISQEQYEKLPDRVKLLNVKFLNTLDQQSDILQEMIRLSDDDLGELDPSKACSIEGGVCESCQ